MNQRILAFLLAFYRSQWFISLVAAALVYVSPVFFGIKPRLNALVVLIFFSTYLEYNLSRLRLLVMDCKKSKKPLVFVKESSVFLLLMASSLLAVCVCLTRLSFSTILVFIIAGFLTLLYSLSFEAGVLQWNGLRKYGFLKLLLIGGVWSVATLVMPALELGLYIFTTSFGILFLQRFCFLIAITLPFDVRDEQQDRLAGIKTWAVLYGQKKVERISIILICAFLLLGLAMVQMFDYRMYRVDLLLAVFAGWLLFSKCFDTQAETYYFLLDGSLLLMAIGYYVSF